VEHRDAIFEFGPRETRGILPGITPRQTASGALSLILAFICLRALPPGISILGAVVVGALGLAFTVWPVNGRPAVEWTDVAFRFGLRRLMGKTGYRTLAPEMGHTQSLDGSDLEILPPIDLPDEISSLEILSLPAPGGGEAGIAYDGDTGSYTATLVVTATDFALLDEDDQLRKLQGWAAVLANFAREDSPVSRIQWVERTLPANGDAMLDYLRENRDPEIALDSPVMRSYLALQDQASGVEQEHELLVTLRIETGNRTVRKRAKRLGDGRDGFCALLMGEVGSLQRGLEDAGVEVHGVLTPRALALRIREGSNPYFRPARRDAGVHGAQMGPITSESHWDYYEVDGTLSATYWICQWPRVGVSGTFLSPLILDSDVTRAVSLTMEPVPPLKAMRKAEAAATAMEGDEDARQRKGYRTGSKLRRQQRAVVSREVELADGHAEIQFSGFITVSARSERELDASCAEVEQAASQARLEVMRLKGEQDLAVTYTMPLARGLSNNAF